MNDNPYSAPTSPPAVPEDVRSGRPGSIVLTALIQGACYILIILGILHLVTLSIQPAGATHLSWLFLIGDQTLKYSIKLIYTLLHFACVTTALYKQRIPTVVISMLIVGATSFALFLSFVPGLNPENQEWYVGDLLTILSGLFVCAGAIFKWQAKS